MATPIPIPCSPRDHSLGICWCQMTPMHWYIRNCHGPQVIDVIINYNAAYPDMIYQRDASGVTPFDAAVSVCNHDAAEMIRHLDLQKRRVQDQFAKQRPPTRSPPEEGQTSSVPIVPIEVGTAPRVVSPAQVSTPMEKKSTPSEDGSAPLTTVFIAPLEEDQTLLAPGPVFIAPLEEDQTPLEEKPSDQANLSSLEKSPTRKTIPLKEQPLIRWNTGLKEKHLESGCTFEAEVIDLEWSIEKDLARIRRCGYPEDELVYEFNMDRLGGMPDTLEDYIIQRKWGCTCGGCREGWLSPRTSSRVANMACCVIHIMTAREENTFPGIGTHPHPEKLFPQAPPTLRNSMTRNMWHGYRNIFSMTVRLLNDTDLPLLEGHVMKLARSKPGVSFFLHKGGKIMDALDILVKLAELNSQSLKHMRIFGEDFAARFEENFRDANLPTCKNDLDFELVRRRIGLPEVADEAENLYVHI